MIDNETLYISKSRKVNFLEIYAYITGKIMQKLNLAVINKMLSSNLTNAEVDFMIEISHFQDNQGRIQGIYYKDICSAIKVSFQTFYDAMRGLERKGIIKTTKEHYQDWNITICDNDFSDTFYKENQEEISKCYLNMGHDIFYNKKFLALNANEKLLGMKTMMIAGANQRVVDEGKRGKYFIGVDLFYDKYINLFKVTKRVIQRYLTRLRAFFTIGIIKGIYYITPRVSNFKYNAPTDLTNIKEHIGDVVFRRNKVSTNKNEKSYKETIDLMGQYSSILKNNLISCFTKAVKDSIRRKNELIKNRQKWNRQLYPKFIHQIMLVEINATK